MTIQVLRSITASEVQAAVKGFSARYVMDWDEWLAADRYARPQLFGPPLRKWQATRSRGSMRRLRAEATHEHPFLEDLLERASEPLLSLGDLAVLTVAQRSRQQDEVLVALWIRRGFGGCVGVDNADGVLGSR